MQEAQLLTLLHSLEISFLRFDHPPVYTCEEARVYLNNAPGAGTKNLFLQNGKPDGYFLLVVDENKRVDINALARLIGAGKLRFASADAMQTYLGIEPGSVTLLAILNDEQRLVKLFIDRDLWLNSAVQCHPLTNTATLILTPADIERLLTHNGRAFTLLNVPSKT